MKKALIILSLFLVPLVIYSCVTNYYDIVDVEFTASGEQNEDGNTIVRDELKFYVRYKLDLISHIYTPKLIDECYANSGGQRLRNSLIRNSFTLSFDQPFSFNGELIPAGTNVLEIADIKNEITIKDNTDNYGMSHSTRIYFSETFIENSDMEGDYTVEFSCRTSDDRAFQKSTTITVVRE